MTLRNLLPLGIAALLGFALGLVEAMERLSYANTLSWAEVGLAVSLAVGFLAAVGVRARLLPRLGVCLLRMGLSGGVFAFVFEGMRLMDKLGKPGLALASWAFAGVLALLLARLVPAGSGRSRPRGHKPSGSGRTRGGARTRSISRVAALLTAASAATACGAGSGHAGGHHASGQARGRLQLASSMPLTDRLLSSPRFPGYHGLAAPTLQRDPRIWVNAIGKVPFPLRQARRLVRQGFVAGAYENFAAIARSTVEVTPLVEQFRTPRGARAELAHFRSQPAPGLVFHHFAVSGIPHAAGAQARGPFLLERTVAFVRGAFYYQVRVSGPRGSRKLPGRNQLVHGCRSWYRRVAAD